MELKKPVVKSCGFFLSATVPCNNDKQYGNKADITFPCFYDKQNARIINLCKEM